MAGKFVISLDFELMWGVRDKRSVADYGDAVLNVRQVVPHLLSRFSQFGIRATWATVGLLFCRTRDDMRDLAPALRPDYQHAGLSPYAALDTEVGHSEADDPYHFARSLIDAVAQTPGQEIATHTFSHFCCLEEGHTPEAFDADLAAAQAIARDAGHDLRSIVFPRNQFAADHLAICRKHGLHSFRGNPSGFAYRAASGDDTTLAMRGVRLADSIMPLSSRTSFRHQATDTAFVDIRASRFLRPVARRAPAFSALHQRRILSEMRKAARLGEVYHLWWHPHNMGRKMDENLAQLDRILAEYRRLRDKFGFESAAMGDFASPAQIAQ